MLTSIAHDRLINLKPLFFVPRHLGEVHTLSQRVAYLLLDAHDVFPEAEAIFNSIHRDLPITLRSAFDDGEPMALLEIHKTLFQIYETHLCHPLSPICLHQYSPWLVSIRQKIETAWLNTQLLSIQGQLPHQSEARHSQRLCSWFVEQAQKESDLDRSVLNFLKNQASIKQFNIFILSDALLNYRFCDALALAQLHFSEIAKAEIVSNMFDESGRGVAAKSHSRQLTEMLTSLGLQQPTSDFWENDWRPHAGHNLYFFLGLNRRHYFKSLGSLAMPELFDPFRDRPIVAGLQRLYPESSIKYDFYANHIETDEEHGLRWLNHVITPIVEVLPEAGMELAIGGALRMEAMRHYNGYLADRFGLIP